MKKQKIYKAVEKLLQNIKCKGSIIGRASKGFKVDIFQNIKCKGSIKERKERKERIKKFQNIKCKGSMKTVSTFVYF